MNSSIERGSMPAWKNLPEEARSGLNSMKLPSASKVALISLRRLRAQEAARPISDQRGTLAQRRHLVGVLVKRALRVAAARAVERSER